MSVGRGHHRDGRPVLRTTRVSTRCARCSTRRLAGSGPWPPSYVRSARRPRRGNRPGSRTGRQSLQRSSSWTGRTPLQGPGGVPVPLLSTPARNDGALARGDVFAPSLPGFLRSACGPGIDSSRAMRRAPSARSRDPDSVRRCVPRRCSSSRTRSRTGSHRGGASRDGFFLERGRSDGPT